jgi:hypothetical protein
VRRWKISRDTRKRNEQYLALVPELLRLGANLVALRRIDVVLAFVFSSEISHDCEFFEDKSDEKNALNAPMV